MKLYTLKNGLVCSMVSVWFSFYSCVEVKYEKTEMQKVAEEIGSKLKAKDVKLSKQLETNGDSIRTLFSVKFLECENVILTDSNLYREGLNYVKRIAAVIEDNEDLEGYSVQFSKPDNQRDTISKELNITTGEISFTYPKDSII